MDIVNPNDGLVSLREAIAASAPGDTIDFVVAGTVSLNAELLIGRALTIKGPGARRLSLNGRSLNRVFHILPGAGVAVKYDKVRVAIGLAHMADDLRKYAAQASCPVAILRGTHSSELTMAQAKEIAGCWKNAAVIDVEGDYALQMENPSGLAKALSSFAAQAVRA